MENADREKEFQADFEKNASTCRTSTVRRPDAVSLDYQTCFTFGPVAFVDSSEGITNYVWKVWHANNTVYMARNLGEGWGAEAVVFRYAGVPILEVDAAFDQTGNIVVCCERATGFEGASEIWIYYFDSLDSAYVFRKLADGRTPRALLDDPFDSENNDILVFFVKGVGATQSIVYYQQRDRYSIEYATPVVGALNDGYDYFVEDIAKLVNNRLVLIYSRRNIATGRYELLRWESGLYPFYQEPEEFSAGARLLGEGSELRIVFLTVNSVDDPQLETSPVGFVVPEEWSAGARLLDWSMVLPVIVVAAADSGEEYISAFIDAEEWVAGARLLNGLLVLPVIDAIASIEEWTAGSRLRSTNNTLVQVVIPITADIEEITAGSRLLSGTLAVP